MPTRFFSIYCSVFILISVLLGCWAILSPCVYADYIILKNGGRLEGEIIQETDEIVGINVPGMGNITFQTNEVEQVVREKPRRLPTRIPRLSTPTPVKLIELESADQPEIDTGQSIWLQPTVTPLFRPNQPQRRAPAPTPIPVQRPRNQEEPSNAPPIPPPSDIPPERSDPGIDRPAPSEENASPWDTGGEGGGFPEIGDFDQVEKQVMAVLGGFLIGFVFIFVLIYVYFAFCYYFIAIKTETEPAWWAWLPVLGPMLLLKVGGKPRWWVIFLYLGLISSIIFISISLSDFQSQSFFEETKPKGNMVVMDIINNILSLVSGIFSYLMWAGVCEARGKNKNFAVMMHLAVFGIGFAFCPITACLCFLPMVLIGGICFLVFPAIIAFSK